MMKTLIAVLMGLSTAAHAATVYRWVDENGTIHYSDTPHTDAETIKLKEPNTYDAPANLPKIEPRQESPAQEAQYQSLTLTQPEPESTIWNNQGEFTASIRLEPALDTAAGHTIQFKLDGDVVATTQSRQWHFSGVNRGAHTVQAVVVDDRGKALIQSEPVTLYLHQQSINLPARKANP